MRVGIENTPSGVILRADTERRFDEKTPDFENLPCYWLTGK
jgi:hypothetical protein